MLSDLESRLKGKVVILGVGNTLKSDDGAGSILASRLKDLSGIVVLDAGVSPENYLEKIVRHKPDTVLIIDSGDFGSIPGDFKLIEPEQLDSAPLFFTHNASISLSINYLQSNLKADIIMLVIQPKTVAFGDFLSSEVAVSIDKLEAFFLSLTGL